MTPAELSRTVRCALRAAIADGELTLPGALPDHVLVAPPRPGGAGDLATNVALQLSGPAHRPPRAVAEILQHRLEQTPGITKIEITGPGFLNFTLSANPHAEAVAAALREGGAYADSKTLAGETFVLRPTPGDVRAKTAAEALANVLRTAGAEAATPDDRPAQRVVQAPPGEGIPQGGTGWPGTLREPPHPARTET
ncbi:hypothetical protein G5C51_12540, partial [Streptomyces sp. A7024]|nr:hypothetical protein [Streptomyces coryli]